MIRRLSACSIPLEVLVEPLPVVLADAVDPHRAQQPRSSCSRQSCTEASRSAAVGRQPSVAVQHPRRQPDQDAQRRQEDRQERRDQERDHQQPGRQNLDPRREVEIGEQAVANVIDLARPEVDHRPDTLGRQRRLAQPVHLAMNLPPQARSRRRVAARAMTRRRQIDHDPRSGRAGPAPAPAASPAHPGCCARWATTRGQPDAAAVRPGDEPGSVLAGAPRDQREIPESPV